MLLTFGHGTATATQMTELLRDAEVAVLVYDAGQATLL